MELNQQQQLAVQHKNGPLLILAGAGSGKTRVLTERVVALINNRTCHPSQILAVTFTNKAASEMRGRIESRIGTFAREAWINTFHSACLKILRRHGDKVGLPPNFAIFDDSDQISLIKKILIELNIGDKLFTPRSVLEKISRAKDSLISPKDYPDGDFYQAKVASVYRRYDEELRRNGCADFGDLIMLTVKLFKKNPEILEHYQDKFLHILVDEYQDTNHSQYTLMKMLAEKHKNICVVGDPDQSIYAWRGADISNILEFERDFPGAKVIKLEQNYRSTKNILAASDAVIENNTSRKPKTLWTENEEGDLIGIVETQDERKEARLVAEKIRDMRVSGTSLKDIAIFYRTNAQSRLFEDELRNLGVPYTIFGGTRFYDRSEIKNIIAYLRLVNNQSDDVCLKRIINTPIRGIGKTTVDRLTSYASNANMSMYEFLTLRLSDTDFSNGTRQKLALFVNLIRQMTELTKLPLPELVTEAIAKTKYVEALLAEKTDEANDRIANIDELISAVSEAYKQNPEMKLADFLDQVALISDIDKYSDNEDVLPLMTLHLAKGLEFDHVFIVGLEEGILPHIRAIDESDELEEERRLFYVGMTRARKSLCLCHANERMVRGNYNYNVPSRFLEEIPAKYLVQLTRTEKYRHIIKKQEHDSFDSDFNQVQPNEVFDQEIVDSQEPSYHVGQRVRHPVFGSGIIRKTEGPAGKQKLIIQFNSGELKKVSAEFANLSII